MEIEIGDRIVVYNDMFVFRQGGNVRLEGAVSKINSSEDGSICLAFTQENGKEVDITVIPQKVYKEIMKNEA